MSNSGIPLQSAQNPAPDEDLLAMLGLHPAQMQVAHGIASGTIHPQQVLDAATPKPAPDVIPPDIARPGAPRIPLAGIAPTPDVQGQVDSRPAPSLPAVAPPPVLSGQTASPRIAPALPVQADPLTERTSRDQAEAARLDSTGSGVSQIHNPIVRNLARVGSGIATAFFPSIAAQMPGFDLHHQVLVNEARGRVGEDLGESEKEAQIGETGARTAHENAQADAAANPKVGTTPEEETLHDLMTGDNGHARVNPDTGKPYQYLEAFQKVYQAKQDTKPDKAEKEASPEQQAFDALIKQGMTPPKALEEIHKKANGAEAGTWQLGEDKDGKPILWNSKSGAQRDAGGIAKPGTHEKATQAEAGAQQAINYAKDYVARGVFTGPGDEALQEKFFELAKPKTGFRMSQPQMDMLQNSRSWMNSMEAHVRHATTGTWFSPEQRSQIFATMQQLSDAQQKTSGAAKPAAAQTATQTATGPDGHKIKVKDGKWVDAATEQPIQ